MDKEKRRQWQWFAALWLGGLVAVGCVSYLLKLLLKWL